MERRSQEDRDAAGEEGVREMSAGLLGARHDETELRARHVLQQIRPRLRVLRILLEVCVRARHLRMPHCEMLKFMQIFLSSTLTLIVVGMPIIISV